jgi:cobalamin biosynthesis protein CobT
MLPAIPVIVVLLGCGAYFRRDKQRGIMTPERTKIFNAAISGGMADPDNLDKLAKSFEEQGLAEQAALLRQRASLKRLPNEVKLARRAIWRKAIKSKNRAAILRLAMAYDGEGCTSAAMRLKEIASGLPDKLPAPESQMSGEAVEASEEESPEESTSGTDEESSDSESPPDRQAAE